MANDLKLAGTRRKSLTTMMAALLAGSIAATAGGVAFAKTDGQAVDPAKFQQLIEKRVDKALGSTDATTDQKKKVTEMAKSRITGRKSMPNCCNARAPLSVMRRQSESAMPDSTSRAEISRP